jgi:glycine cleavage system H protein
MAKVKGFEMPDDLYYHNEYSWVKIEDDDMVKVGMIDFAQSEAGDITYVDLPFEGDEVEIDETCGKVQSAKWIGKLVAPLSGEIVEVNYELEGDATLINSDCYGEGWVLCLAPSKLDEELPKLMKGQAAVDWLEKEVEKLEKEKTEGKSYD